MLPGILYTLAAQAQEPRDGEAKAKLPKITPEMLDQAAMLAGVGPFTAEQKKMMLDGLNDQRDGYDEIRALKLPNSVPPAYVFHPLPAAADKPQSRVAVRRRFRLTRGSGLKRATREAPAPANIEDLAFATVVELANLSAARKITSARAHPDVPGPPQALRSPSCISSSRSPKSARSPRPRPPTTRSPPATIAARSTAFPGAQKICSP